MAEELTEIEEKIYQLAKPYLTTRNNDIHTQDALEFVLKLLETGKGDRGVAVPAIILHDVGWSKVPEDIINAAVDSHYHDTNLHLMKFHEEAGVKIAAGILRDVGYEGSRVAEILQIVGGHDTRQSPVSINDEIVRDADKLSRYSKGFSLSIKMLGITPEEFYSSLESRLKHWFYLPESKEMARAELEQRQREIADGHFNS